MIKMNVMGIALDTRTGSPIVVLNDTENRRALPIWIGSAEASSIIRKIENIKSVRPMTHDLILNFCKQAGYDIVQVEINDVSNETYFASIVLKNEELQKDLTIDARPSDAIAIAIRAEVDIFVTSNVLASGMVSVDTQKDEQEAQEFKSFIKDLKPSDFDKILKNNFESDQ